MLVLDAFVSYGVGCVWALVLLPLTWSYRVTWLAVARGNKVGRGGKLFDGFKDYKRIFLTILLVKIYTCLWTLLLIIPGIVKSYSYSMTSYILADEPEMKYDAAIEKSMRLMDGNKAKLFLLDLSFISLAILGLCTWGMFLLVLLPCVNTAHAKFYEDLVAGNADE